MRTRRSPLQAELDALRALEEWVRERLYAVPIAGRRADATTAVAAAAAERAYELSDALPEWQNATSAVWRGHLAHVWDFLAGERTEHYELSAAIAAFLTSPLNHIEGQDGPNDFDRPQTIASYAAVVSAVMWGVDFATTAVGQIFECLELKYDGEFNDDRTVDVDAEVGSVRKVVDRIVTAARGAGLTPE
ncbi:MAG: hypothetical protein ACRD0W_03450, partial [Acidimicrobiales bacterium]